MKTAGSWNFDETRRLVRLLHGEAQEELLSPCLDSLLARKRYAGHHLANFEQFVVDRLMSQPEGWNFERLALAIDEDEARQNQVLRTRLAAEAAACAASLHCLLDTLAHAVAYCLGMNLGKDGLTGRQISLSNVRQRLEETGARQSVASALATIDRSTEVKYLEALVNHSKHRSVIRPGFVFDALAGIASFSIEFEAFSYQHDKRSLPTSYARREVKGSLQRAHADLAPWTVEVGCRLVDELSKDLLAV